ncbi:MAG TPA: acyl carrier protein [Methylomirabilota bacterium]|nr:acyl carrier protein [Methylomirabilota bacterium]
MPAKPLVRLEPDEVARVVTAFINGTIMARGHPIRPDDDLERAGLDSMALLKILLFIEAQFGFWMPDQDLVGENIRTPYAFAAYICRRRSPPPPSG